MYQKKKTSINQAEKYNTWAGLCLDDSDNRRQIPKSSNVNVSLWGRNLQQLSNFVSFPYANSKNVNANSLQRKRRPTHTVLGTTVSHNNQNLLSDLAATSEQGLPCVRQSPTCSSSTSWVSDVVNCTKNISLSAIRIEAKYTASTIREQNNANTGEYLGYLEGHNHSFYKVKTAFKVSFSVRLDASRTIDDKSQINFSSTHCNETKQKR